MTKTVKIIIVIAICVLVVAGVVLGGIFGSRAVEQKKRAEAEKQAIVKRFEVVSAVERNFLSGINSDWSYDLTTEELKELDDAGDYVVYEGWVEFFSGILYASPLQTAKLEKLSEALASEDGQKLFEEFDDNAGLLVSLLREVEFTGADVSTVVYTLIRSLVQDGSSVLVAMKEKLWDVKSAKNVDNVNASISAVETELNYLNFTKDEKDEILSAVTSAESAIKALVKFAYTTSIDTLTDNMVNVMNSEDGALSQIENEEIQTVVTSMLSNVRELKAAMTTEEIAKLNNAIRTVTDKYDGTLATSRIVAQVLNYAKLAYVFTDSIPYMASMVISAANVVNGEFLNMVKEYVENIDVYDSRTKEVNSLIILARVERAMLENMEESELEGLVNVVAAQAETDYRRAMPVVAVDACVNLISIANADVDDADALIDGMVHSSIWSEALLKREIVVAAKMVLMSVFEKTYFKYLEGEASIAGLSQAASMCDFTSSVENGGLGIAQNPYDYTTDTTRWYKYYMDEGSAKVLELAQDLLPTLKNDLTLCIEDYYQDELQIRTNLEAFCQRELLSPLPEGATDDEISARNALVNDYMAYANESRVLWVNMLVQLLSSMVK
ncbi:MAG: hypothetical protein IK048_02120 [Clostridia bacterium]|nr:hypothetical protein [Clostridia bacterium]